MCNREPAEYEQGSKPAVGSVSAGDERWRQVQNRVKTSSFVYAVTSTGIFCRTDCASRRPARQYVRYFATAAKAKAAGFRACLRCLPDGPEPRAVLVQQVAAFLAEHLEEQVSLARLAALTGKSAFTVQRVFSAGMGISPRSYANALRAGTFRQALHAKGPGGERGGQVTNAIYAAGCSGPNRARHAAPLGMTSRAYRARGKGEHIRYVTGAAPEAFGRVLVAATDRGVCAVLLGDHDSELSAELSARFPAASVAEDQALQPWLLDVLGLLTTSPMVRTLPLDLRATAFQARVWAALSSIPRGETRSYAEVATALGCPSAVRAVASACARNPAALLVPCHRVVGSNGKLTGYRWGIGRKRLLLDLESR